jgi:hypothetical protein
MRLAPCYPRRQRAAPELLDRPSTASSAAARGAEGRERPGDNRMRDVAWFASPPASPRRVSCRPTVRRVERSRVTLRSRYRKLRGVKIRTRTEHPSVVRRRRDDWPPRLPDARSTVAGRPRAFPCAGAMVGSNHVLPPNSASMLDSAARSANVGRRPFTSPDHVAIGGRIGAESRSCRRPPTFELGLEFQHAECLRLGSVMRWGTRRAGHMTWRTRNQP